MKEKLLYRAPQLSWGSLLATEIICLSSDIDETEYTEITW